MSAAEPQPVREQSAELLATVERDAARMVHSSDSPRGLLSCVVATVSLCLTLTQAFPAWAYWLWLLFVPLALWYWNFRRGTARPRTLLNSATGHFGAYTGYFFLGMLLVNCLGFWEATQPTALVAKILVGYVCGMFVSVKLRNSFRRARVEDGNERSS